MTKGRKMRVVVAGQMPPPIGGQNINIKRFYDVLLETGEFKVEHWRFQFTREWKEGRRFGLWKVFELVAVAWRLLRLRGAGRIDFILFPSGGPHTIPIIRDVLLLPLARCASRRVAVHFQAAGIAEACEKMPKPAAAFCRAVFRLAATEAISITEYGKRDPRSLGIRKVTVIPFGIEDRYRAELKVRDESRGATLTILNVGHLCPDKGTPELVRAFAQLRRSQPGLRLKLVGECLPPLPEEKLKALVRELGVSDAVEATGILTGEELDRAYAQADLFVFSTVAPYESFGLAMVEAMMWGLPVVATEWRANLEVLGGNPGGIRCVTTSGLAEGLEGAIAEMLACRGEWPAWGSRNRARFQERFAIGVLRENFRKHFSA